MTTSRTSSAVSPLVRLGELGQSPWYDYITRDLMTGGELARLIAEDGLRGMTSNPTIFEKAIAASRLYDAEIRGLAEAGRNAQEIFEHLAVADVQAACDAFAGVHHATGGGDGLVSLEVSPALARDTDATIQEAERLWRRVDRANAMIKIPGTQEGLPAIAHCIAAGVSVNVTLLFSVERYAEVIEAFLDGLERRIEAGLPLRTITSVASFFVSRVDAKVDPLLDRLGDPEALRGRIAIANACAAYRLFEWSLGTPRWDRLAKAGARPQRPLWASTSTKDPRYSDVHYVEALVAPRTVNTLPPETFAAYREHGSPAVRIQDGVAAAPGQLRALAELGIDLGAITRALETEGVAKFAASYAALLAGIEAKAAVLAGAGRS
jgi:transaldolase